mgnify:CR=1 FL=1
MQSGGGADSFHTELKYAGFKTPREADIRIKQKRKQEVWYGAGEGG